MSSSAVRRPKWHPPPPPPSPVLLRHRRKQHADTETGENRVNVSPDRGRGGRRERVMEEREREEEEEKWRFQADVLRAECGLLRRERENAIKEMEKNKIDTERTIRSALRILGKKKTYEEHKGNGVLKGEMEDLEEKLEELLKENVISSDSETKKCNNFNKKAFILQRRLEKLRGESKDKRAREIRDMVQASFPSESMHKLEERSSASDQNHSNKFFDVEVLRSKMEGISKGVYKRMEEEYGAMLVSTTHTPSTSKRFEFPDDDSFLSIKPPPYQEHGLRKCSGHCKTVVRKIMEQVREESKQWSEMQEMLGQVKKEMDQLKVSRDFWQHRALESEHQTQFLHSNAQDWKRKALTIKSKTKQLKREVYALKRELSNYRKDQKGGNSKIKDGPKIISLGAHIAKEKCDLVYRLKEKENYRSATREIEQQNLNNDARRKSQMFDQGVVGLIRLPFQDIGNSASPKAKQNSKIILPL